MQKLHYTIKPKCTGSHIFSISTFIENTNSKLLVKLPKWIPGSYKIRDFAKHISKLKATDKDNKKLEINNIDSCSWEIIAKSKNITITYEVYAYDLSVRGAYLDNQRLFFNHCCVFLDIVDFSSKPRTIEIESFKNWEIFTELPKKENSKENHKKTNNIYYANSYLEQVDCPVESTQKSLQSKANVEKIPHKMIYTGTLSDNYDINKTMKLVAKICSVQMKLFKGSPIDKNYLFMTYIEANQYGGLEHKNSTALMASPEMLIKKGEKLTEKNIDFLGLCSHEYFHLWNIKRLRPLDLIPYKLYSEQHTQMLWLFEGWTSYYDELMLLRAGIIDKNHFLKRQAKNISRVLKTPGRFSQSIAESSFQAWTKLYQANENSVNTMVSYYSKGAIFALFLDLWIRKNSNNKFSLDNVMFDLWQNYAEKEQGIDENIVLHLCMKLIPSSKHKQLQKIFKAGIHGTKDIEFEKILTEFGISYNLEAESKNTKKHTSTAKIKTQKQEGKIIILSAEQNSSAVLNGISAKDEIIAINNQSVEQIDIDEVFNFKKPNTELKILLNRRGRIFSANIILEKPEKTELELEFKKGNELNKNWLSKWI